MDYSIPTLGCLRRYLNYISPHQILVCLVLSFDDELKCHLCSDPLRFIRIKSDCLFVGMSFPTTLVVLILINIALKELFHPLLFNQFLISCNLNISILSYGFDFFHFVVFKYYLVVNSYFNLVNLFVGCYLSLKSCNISN